uniref:Uncharacterized protein n=1 Tax=Cacopsylla melanoneura TaxID=428564 RepID=A0A8D8X8W3_9HEMI
MCDIFLNMITPHLTFGLPLDLFILKCATSFSTLSLLILVLVFLLIFSFWSPQFYQQYHSSSSWFWSSSFHLFYQHNIAGYSMFFHSCYNATYCYRSCVIILSFITLIMFISSLLVKVTPTLPYSD